MNVNIKIFDSRTIITFRGCDVTEDLIGIVGGIAAGRYCFEANVLLSSEFAGYMELVKNYSNDQFGIELSNIDEPYVLWGRFKDGSIQSMAGEHPQNTLDGLIAVLNALTPEDEQALQEMCDEIQESKKVYCSQCKKQLS